ncbi:MAG: tetratricopeptide repeat protein [Kiritimatiellae bacterium]|nr:tetratricopeptide repeat protein [Kiritimatiellia bacterium]
MRQKIYFVIIPMLFCVALHPALAQYGGPGMGNRGYASDGFEGFESLEDGRIKQKEGSIWFRLSADTPAEQLAYSRQREADGKLNSARKGYEALVRKWPATTEAAQAQLALANVQEKRKQYSKAFEEYQYALTHYAGNCPYEEIIDRQFRIANYLLHNNTSMFGLVLSGTKDIRMRFEQIVVNAPRSPVAAEAMLKIGSIREGDKDYEEAIKVYDGLLNRYPNSKEAATAAYLSSKCRYTLSVKHSYNENRCRESIAFLKAALLRLPEHPDRKDLKGWLLELTDLLIEQNYQRALFYDTQRYNNTAKVSAYRRFLAEFSDSKYGETVRNRLNELNAEQPGNPK